MSSIQIKYINGYTLNDLHNSVNQGGRFVMFQYTVSIVLMTFRRSSDIYFIPDGKGTFGKHLPYTAISLFFGWWGIPWGPIYTIGSLFRNLGGGKDVTREVMGFLIAQHQNTSAPATANVDIDSLHITKD